MADGLREEVGHRAAAPSPLSLPSPPPALSPSSLEKIERNPTKTARPAVLDELPSHACAFGSLQLGLYLIIYLGQPSERATNTAARLAVLDGRDEAIELLAVCLVLNLWINLELQHQTADSTLRV